MDKKEWLILNFTLPKDQSTVRVSVWRKLKRCGSVNIGQSMWVLPSTETHIETFNEISKEISENNGISYIAKADFLKTGSNTDLISLFNKVRDEEYLEFIDKCEDFFHEIDKETERKNFTFAELEENEEEHNKLVEWLNKISSRDFFQANQKGKAEQELRNGKILLDEFSSKVYRHNEED